jgi:hypothetical protein
MSSFTREWELEAGDAVPIAAPSNEADALMTEFAIVSASICHVVTLLIAPGPIAGSPIAETDEFINDREVQTPPVLIPKPEAVLPPSAAITPAREETIVTFDPEH